MTDASDMDTLPDGWVWVKLGDVGEIVTGNTPKKSEPENYGNYLPLVKPSELTGSTIINIGNEYLSEIGASKARILPPESVMVVCIGSLGKAGITGQSMATNQQINAIIPYQEISSRFLYYYVLTSTFQESLQESASATTVAIINKGNFSKLKIPLAPYAEQVRIVAKIEQLFTVLDAGVEALERLQANLKRYKASVLKAACEGTLVPQDPDDEPADQLLARILGERRAQWEAEQLAKYDAKGKTPPKGWQSKYTEPTPPDTSDLPELPDGWVWASIGEVFEVFVGATPSRKVDNYWNGEINWVSSGEVAFCRIYDTKEKITELGLANASTSVHPPGTVMLGMIGEGKTRGQAAILEIPAAHNQNSAAIRVSESGLPPEYLYYYLMSTYEQTRRGSSGNNQPALNKSRVQAMVLPLAPKNEQLRIVDELEKTVSIIDELETILSANLKRAERLRQAILKEAFAGRLVPQDASDEPASVLLSRLRGEGE